MRKISFYFNKYILENLPIITFVSLTVLFIINSFLNIGLFTDETFTLSSLLGDLSWGDENRYFEVYISCFGTILLLLLGVTNIDFLIKVHGFWSYFSTLIFLIISYYLYPRKNKNLFVFTLLCYLIIMNIVSGFITVQSFISAGLYWIIIIPMIFYDFNNVSYKKLIMMIIASVFMIKGYQLDIIFIFLFIVLGFVLLKKVKTNKKYLIYIFLSVNIYSFFYSIYNYFFPLNDSYFSTKFYMFEEIFHSRYFLLLIIFFIVFFGLLYILIKNKRTKVRDFISILLILLIFDCLIIVNFIYSIAAFRILNHVLPLVFSFIVYILYNKSKDINIKYLKLLSFILLIAFIFNISVISVKWNKQLNGMYMYLAQNEGFLELDNFYTDLSEHSLLHHTISILIQKQHGVSYIKAVFAPVKREEDNIISFLPILPNLEKYGIYYSKNLLKEVKKYDSWNN